MSTSTTSTTTSPMSTSSSNGIVKGLMAFRVMKFIDLMDNESIVIDEKVQRDEVNKHPSNPDLLLKSLSESIPIGIATGYVNGVRAPTDQITLTKTKFLADFLPTPETPIRLADFGHRYRFLRKIRNGEATINGSTLAELKTRNPPMFQQIMDTEIPFECVFHTSGEVPEEYIANLFRVLQLSAPASVGEKEKASSNRELVSAGEALIRKFETNEINRSFPTERAAGRAIAHSLLIGAADRSRMSLKTADFEDPLSNEQWEKSNEIIQKYVNMLTKINRTLTQQEEMSNAAVKECETRFKAAPKGDAKEAIKVESDTLKRVHKSKREALVRYNKAKLDLALDGVFITGLQEIPDQADNFITKWWMTALETDEAWKKLSGEVKKNPGAARSFNKNAWLIKWGVLKTHIGENRLEISDSDSVTLSVI